MPTGRRKLLLADDSPTVQKVVSLTFDDEGFKVVAVGTGEQALAELERDVPDVVLADVHMPAPAGYELCARIKRDERTRHVPVMLLVGAFEPFDEAEARKSGADEILTKPFQSIRELVNKVSVLLGGQPDVKKTDKHMNEDEPTGELRPDAVGEAHAAASKSDAWHEAASTGDAASAASHVAAAPTAFTDLGMDDENIESVPAAEFATRAAAPPAQSFAAAPAREARAYAQTFESRSAAAAAADDALLELGDMDSPRTRPSTAAGEFVLDMDDEETYAPQRAQLDASVYTDDAPSAVEMQAAGSMSMAEPSGGWIAPEEFTVSPEAVTEPVQAPTLEPEAAFSTFYDATRRDAATNVGASVSTETMSDAPQASTASMPEGAAQLSPETIDAIARRVVEHLSDRVVREIAWEVVPDLAERLIRRKLEEEQPRAQ
ncbi:MAG: hypothetical protein QOF61_67 [Acidobacteriota bacterium]|nr:hypothetical protein [Acidobacteriota bacterium]